MTASRTASTVATARRCLGLRRRMCGEVFVGIPQPSTYKHEQSYNISHIPYELKQLFNIINASRQHNSLNVISLLFMSIYTYLDAHSMED
jgi:hypothetical protein